MQAKVAISILAVATATLFTVAAVQANDLFWGDRTILSALRTDDPAWQRFFARFDTRSTISLAFVLPVSAVLWWLKKKVEALVFLLLLPSLLLTVVLPKIFIDRPRPEGTLEGLTDSFPSGTATVSILLLGFLIFLIGEYVAPRGRRIGLQLALGGVILLLGLFRMLAGEHWPSDLVGGYMAGALALWVVIWAYRRVQKGQTSA